MSNRQHNSCSTDLQIAMSELDCEESREVSWLKLLVNPLEGFPGGSVIKNPPANAGDVGSIPGSGGSPGEGNGNPCQYSCPGKSHGQRSLGLQGVGHNLATQHERLWRQLRF